MRVVHEQPEGTEILASDVDVADSLPAQARGLTFRTGIPEKYALVFRFGRVASRSLHMLFVPFPIDAIWLVDDEVTAVKRLRAWVGRGRARADTVIELPAGAAADVEVGDVVSVE